MIFVSCSKSEDKSATSSTSSSAAKSAAPALKEEILTADTFTGDWLVGNWTMDVDVAGDKDSGLVEIKGIKDSDAVVLEGENMTFADFKAGLFGQILSNFSDEMIETLKAMGATVKGDGKLRVNAERNQMYANIAATMDGETLTFDLKLIKK